jgi:hypothetical protein
MSAGDPQSFNRYAYVQNDPVNFVDPSGLDPTVPIGLPAPWGPIIGAGILPVPTGVVNIAIGGSGNGPIDGGVIGGFIGDTGILLEAPGENGGGPGGGGGGGGFIHEAGHLEPQKPSTPCPPSGEQLKQDPKVVAALYQAWRDSHPGASDTVRREQGGWIYARNGQTLIRRAKPGTKDGIDLSNPPRLKGALLIGDFHTHPGFLSQKMNPLVNSDDMNVNMARGVPGLVISEGKRIDAYGPTRRGSFPSLALPAGHPLLKGYPGDAANSVGCP